MAVYYKWIKGCASGATLTDGAWSYITWGNTVGDSTAALPKIEICTGRDGSKTDLGYILANKATGVDIKKKWKFAEGIGVSSITNYASGEELTISPAVKFTSTGTSITTSGNISVKEVSSTALKSTGSLSVDGTMSSKGNISTSGGCIKTVSADTGYIESASYVSAVYFNARSDKRAKENILPAQYNALNIVNNLPIYTFNYKNNKETVTGILAQDLLQIQPKELELVSNINATGENGDYMSIKNDKLMFVLMKAIQEQQKEIDILKSEIAELKKIR